MWPSRGQHVLAGGVGIKSIGDLAQRLKIRVLVGVWGYSLPGSSRWKSGDHLFRKNQTEVRKGSWERCGTSEDNGGTAARDSQGTVKVQLHRCETFRST